MRIENVLSLEIGILLFMTGTLDPAYAETLLSARGYLAGKCYQQVVRFECPKNRGAKGRPSECALLVFPGTQGQLAFPAKGVSEEAQGAPPPQFYLAKFEFLPTKGGEAKVLSQQALAFPEALSAIRESDYLGHPTDCSKGV